MSNNLYYPLKLMNLFLTQADVVKIGISIENQRRLRVKSYNRMPFIKYGNNYLYPKTLFNKWLELKTIKSGKPVLQNRLDINLLTKA